jgi:hypothetical protein
MGTMELWCHKTRQHLTTRSQGVCNYYNDWQYQRVAKVTRVQEIVEMVNAILPSRWEAQCAA